MLKCWAFYCVSGERGTEHLKSDFPENPAYGISIHSAQDGYAARVPQAKPLHGLSQVAETVAITHCHSSFIDKEAEVHSRKVTCLEP